MFVVVVVSLTSLTNISLTTVGAKAVEFGASGGNTTGAGSPVAIGEVFGAKADGILLRLCLGGRGCRRRRRDDDGSLPTTLDSTKLSTS